MCTGVWAAAFSVVLYIVCMRMVYPWQHIHIHIRLVSNTTKAETEMHKNEFHFQGDCVDVMKFLMLDAFFNSTGIKMK